MRQPDDDALLADIVSARHVETFMRGRTRRDLADDVQLRFAVLKGIEIMGEAAGRVTESGRARFPNVPWRDIVGVRHHLVHAYDRVDLDLVWEVVERDIPLLVGQIEPQLPAAEADDPAE